MAIDMNPREGRTILLRAASLEFFPWFVKGGKITKVSGQRVYYKTADGKETFTHGCSAIVDTQKEEETLLRFSAQARTRLYTLRNDLLKERQAVHPAGDMEGSLSSEELRPIEAKAEEPAVVRVRRTRPG